MFDKEWEQRALEAEIACGGIVSGRLGSPDDHPPVGPVLEDEATLKKFLADQFEQMQQKVAARKKRLHEKQFA